ncbi:MAG: molybdopterin-binding protein [Bacteroidales bacterium]|nr:molybdopterin-binding protein [Bacteroidales bacterium]
MEKILKILSVNTSEEKGTVKKPVDSINLNQYGIETDAHSGDWHRQISLLSKESIDRFSKDTNRGYLPGEFAENITLSGMILNEAFPGDKICGKEVEMVVTQIGKKCHGGDCAVFRDTGACVMPKEGIFTKVIKGGTLTKGDLLTYTPRVITIAIITLSTRAYNNTYSDLSGPAIKEATETFFKSRKREFSTEYHLIPDNPVMFSNLLRSLISKDVDLIFTSGGTGVGPNDITPETARAFIDKEIPGIMEHIRTKYGKVKPNALLSRGIAGLSGNSFIFTLPGSINGAKEYMSEILPLTEHLIYMRLGLDTH